MKNFISLCMMLMGITAFAQVPNAVQLVVGGGVHGAIQHVIISHGNDVLLDTSGVQFNELGVAPVILRNLDWNFSEITISIDGIEATTGVWAVPYSMVAQQLVVDNIVQVNGNHVEVILSLLECPAGYRLPSLTEMKLIVNDPVMSILDFDLTGGIGLTAIIAPYLDENNVMKYFNVSGNFKTVDNGSTEIPRICVRNL